MIDSLIKMDSFKVSAIHVLLKYGTSSGSSLHIRLATLTVLLVIGIACQEKASQTLGEAVVAEDGAAAYSDRADFLLESIAGACSFLVSEQDVFDMAIRTRDAVQEQDDFDVTILAVLEAAHDSVLSNEIRPVNCEDIFTEVAFVFIIEKAINEAAAK